MALEFDYASHLYALSKGSKIRVVLASTLNRDGTPDADEYRPMRGPSLADDYEYVMHGKCFRINPPTERDPKLEIFVSFGGLLLSMKGLTEYLEKIKVDDRIYMLVRKDEEEMQEEHKEIEHDVNDDL